MRAELIDDTGGQGRPLVYVPGIDGSGAFLLETAGRLSGRFRLLRVRYLHDRAEGIAGDGYEALAESLARCIRGAGVESALLLGESFGVAVSLRTALDHPGLVAGLALVNGFARYPARLGITLSRNFARFLTPRMFRAGRSIFARHFLFAPRRDEAVLAAFHSVDGGVFGAGYRTRLEMIRRLDLRPRLSEIEQPVAIFAADRDRIVASVEAARVMERGLPDATVEVLGGFGHIVLPFPSEPWVERIEALAERAASRPGSDPAP